MAISAAALETRMANSADAASFVSIDLPKLCLGAV